MSPEESLLFFVIPSCFCHSERSEEPLPQPSAYSFGSFTGVTASSLAGSGISSASAFTAKPALTIATRGNSPSGRRYFSSPSTSVTLRKLRETLPTESVRM